MISVDSQIVDAVIVVVALLLFLVVVVVVVVVLVLVVHSFADAIGRDIYSSVVVVVL